MDTELQDKPTDIVAAYRDIARVGAGDRTEDHRATLIRLEDQVRAMERASRIADDARGVIDQAASRPTIEASAILFRERLRTLASAEQDDDVRDLLLEIPKLMGEYLQSVTQHESAMVMANLLSADADTYRTRVSNYDRARRGKHQALMTRINLAVKSARTHGVEPLIYREVSKDVDTTDRHTIADYSRAVLSLFS